jgi:hypothetical protein
MLLKVEIGNGCFPGECSPELPPAGIAAWNFSAPSLHNRGKIVLNSFLTPSPGVRFRRYASDLNKETFQISKKRLGAINHLRVVHLV